MREVAIVTDSTADLPREWLDRWDVTVVPLQVVIEGTSYDDGTFTQQEYFDRMAKMPGLPTTSQPPVGVFMDAFREALERAGSVVSVHISSKLSGPFQAATEAARELGDRVTVFDSLNLSGGLGLVTMAAAKAAEAGGAVRDVVEAASSMRERVRMLVALDGIENLAKGGRIGKVARLAGGMLNIRPMLEVVDGAFEPVARTRSQQAQMRKLWDELAERVGERTGGTFVVLHALAIDRARELMERIEEAYAPAEVIVQEAGTVITTHTGTGIGVAYAPAE
jgi:DegV family protein with EDD domain